MKLYILVVFCFGSLAWAKHESYIGWKSYYVETATPEQQKLFHNIASSLELDVLSPPLVGREGVVIVQPRVHDAFTESLGKYDIKYRIHLNDLKAAFDYDDKIMEARSNETKSRSGAGRMSYDNYQQWEVIDEYLDTVARENPDIVTLVSPATSYQGRPLKYLKISTTNFEDQSKPVIFIDGGIHAREWLSPPTVTYAIKKLVEDRSDPDLLEKFDWILLPVVNPDGYKFTFTDDRLWRKTLSTNPGWPWCAGVDGNRNYDFFWNTVGTSWSPCGDTYAGPQPFSEAETRVVRDVLQEHLHRMAMYITMHSFGSMILYPWGHDGTLSNNAFALHVVAIAMAEKIDSLSISYFPRYSVGTAVHVLGYGASGASEDYAHYIGVPLSYTYELPGLGWSWEGFNLDPRYIEQVCMETWEGLAVGARRAAELYIPQP